MTYKEIALRMNININTAIARMRYALIKMRKIVDENKITLTK